VNRTLEAKNRALAGIKGSITNPPHPQPEQVIGAHSRLPQVEKSFRMSKTDLAARPIFHHARDSIEAHPTIVFAALAVSRWVENTTGWSIKRFVTTARRYRTIQIQAGQHTITAADPATRRPPRRSRRDPRHALIGPSRVSLGYRQVRGTRRCLSDTR